MTEKTPTPDELMPIAYQFAALRDDVREAFLFKIKQYQPVFKRVGKRFETGTLWTDTKKGKIYKYGVLIEKGLVSVDPKNIGWTIKLVTIDHKDKRYVTETASIPFADIEKIIDNLAEILASYKNFIEGELDRQQDDMVTLSNKIKEI